MKTLILKPPITFLLIFLFLIVTQVTKAQEASKTLEEADKALGRAWQSKDVDTLVSFYEGDGALMWTGYPLMRKNEIREFWKQRWKDPNYKILHGKRDVLLISESGDLAYMQGTSGFQITGEKGSVITQEGNWTSIWRRRDGKWKITSDSFNTSMVNNITSKIAFTSTRNGNAEIYAMNADGANVQRLTDNAATDRLPALSTDCRYIAFESNRDGTRKIYLMNSKGENQKRLTANTAVERFPSWSPDGKKIAFTLANVDGTADIYVVNKDGSQPQRLMENSYEDAHPSWSPDGRKIVFHSYKHGKAQIFVMNSDGSEVIRLTNNSFGDFEPTWSPDGKSIAFVSNRDGNFEIYLMDSDGGNQRRLTQTESNESRVSWSPDGKHLVFGVFSDAGEKLSFMNRDGSALQKPSTNFGSGSFPNWARCY